MSDGLSVALASLVAGLVLQPALIHWLRRHGVMDVPNHRSSHVDATPRGGGIAVLGAVGVGLIVSQANWQGWVAWAGAAVLGGIGLVDDFRGVDAKTRLAAVLLAGAVAGILLDSPLHLAVAVPAMALWTAAYVNAFNFMDGINGISALTGIIAGAAYAAMGVAYGSSTLLGVGAATLGACASFLPFNVPHAKVFLGDVGSYGLGFLIAASAWIAWGEGTPILLAVSPTLLYLADTGWTLVRRAHAGKPLMEAHREHAYQRLVASGRSHTVVAALVAGASAGIVTLMWIGTSLGSVVLIVTVLAAAVVLGVFLLAAPGRASSRP